MCSRHTHWPERGSQLQRFHFSCHIIKRLSHTTLLNSLIVQGATVVAVTRSAAVHVIGQTPVLRLQEEKRADGCFSTPTPTLTLADGGSSPHTGRRRVPEPGACRSSSLCGSRRGSLEAKCPAGCRCTLWKRTATDFSVGKHSFVPPTE